MDRRDSSLFKFPQIYIVEASAGSGKTYALAKRYIQLLINPYLKPEEIPLNSILAITFTNKAAIEMKERILDFLKRIALDNFSSQKEKEDILSSLAVDEESARKKASLIMDCLLKNYNFFQVQTIDSFINAILFSCAFKLGLSAGFQTRQDHSDYLAYSLDKLIDEASRDKEVLKLFHNFLVYYLLINNKTSWFPKQDILLAIISLFSKSNKYAGAFVSNGIQSKDSLESRRLIIRLMAELKDNMPAGANAAFVKVLNSFLKQNKDIFDIDKLSDFFKREDFPANKGCVVPKKIEGLWIDIRKNIIKLCELESASTFNYYIDIFNMVLGHLENVTTNEDVLFLEALNKQVRGLFDEKNLMLPELYYRLATSFRHFLIDEFQDTSRLQWENLFMMVEDALSSGGSLFYVGDKKQAIYRFRGGEVSLIDSAKYHFKGFNLIEEPLNMNYRSQKEIVEFNNMVFSENNLKRFFSIAAEGLDANEAIKIFQGSEQGHRKDASGGYVKLESIDAKDSHQQKEVVRLKLLDCVKDLNKRFNFKDISIIARKNSEIELLTSWLLEENIPVESEKTLNIRENSYIKELISFLRFLNSPIDNLSFASFIMGDIFLEASSAKAKDIQDFIFRSREKTKQGLYLYREFRVEFQSLWDNFIEEFFKSVGFIPLYELVISIFGKFNVMHNFSGYQGFFMKFLEFIKDQEEENPGISLFLEFFDVVSDDQLYVNVKENDSVKICTIHKSKGLEFSVVIVPFLEMNVKVDQEVIDEQSGEIKLLYLKKKYTEFSPFLSRLYKEQYMKSFVDELNSIYVAFTRAKNELYVFVSPKAEKGPNMATMLFPEPILEFGKKANYMKDKKSRSFIVEIKPSVYKDWVHLLKDEFIDEGIMRGRDKVLKGKVLHYALSFVENLYNQDKGLIVENALRRVPMKFPFVAEDLSGYKTAITRLLAKKELKPFFEVSDGKICLEKELVDRYGDTKRVDRLIVKPKEAWIVDYKSAKDVEGEYQKQVGEYMKIVKDIYPALKIKGFLLYLDDLSLEEIAPRDMSF